MIKFFKYQGSKEHIISIVNNIGLINTDHKVYIEPFIGSGTIFINIPDMFDKYIINDIDDNIISMWNALEYYEYDDYVITLTEIFAKFGDIENDKQAYYDFRDYYNNNYHFTTDKKKGLYLYFLTNSCINSMLRFGPNGMNQGFGNRLYLFSEEECNFIKRKLSKTKILNGDFGKVMRGVQDAFIYLDPPYVQRPTTYSKKFDNNQLVELITLIHHMHSKNSIFYSDIENEISDTILKLGFTKITTKEMRNISPLRKLEFIEKNEVLYHNIKSRFFI